MSKFRFVGLIISTIFGEILPDFPQLKIVGFGYIKIPPLSEKKDTPIDFSVLLGSGGDYTILIGYAYSSEVDYRSLYEETGNAKQADRTIYFPKELVKSGQITFKFIVRSKVIKDGSEVRLLPATKATPHNIALTNNYVTHFETIANYCHATRAETAYKTYPEVFDFINFQREQEQSYYNYLDLDKFSFKYECKPNNNFSYLECYMYLQNYNHWFDNIGTTFGNFRKIPLILVKKENEFHFELLDPIYVSKNTNQLFSAYQENCFLTKKIFLPKNGYTKDTIQMNLNLKGAGFNESSISQTFLFSFNSNYFGDCYNSEYCISSSQAESNFDYGEIEEH